MTTTGHGDAKPAAGTTATAAVGPDGMLEELRAAVPGVVTDPARVLPHAHDASHFLRTPRALVVPRDANGVGDAMRIAGWHGVPLTLRSGGTSLSGQAGTDGLLVDVRRHFRDIEVLEGGAAVRVQPGATVRAVNARLLRYGRKLGPDPASEIACTIGGVIANNSSGMLCGTTQNTYRTLRSAVLVLANGDVVDTGAADADGQLYRAAPDLVRGLERLRDRIRANPAWVEEIERQFAIKNTMGYGLNAFLDFDTPAEIFTRLVVGSEGTLAFVAEATFETVPRHAHASTSLLVFDDIFRATAALPALVESGLGAIELLDAASLRVAAGDPASPQLIRGLRAERHAALLVEHQRADPGELDDAVGATSALVATLPVVGGGAFTTDAAERAAYWAVRKGLYAAVAGARPSGTTAMLEDIAVPVPDLASTCNDLQALFERHGYDDSVIFGHAKDGNIHFLVNERFDGAGRLDAYAAFTDDLVDLVLGRGGTLKAEHGTGRIMAPFVERQYGAGLTDCMRELKRLADPAGTLNPGVLLTDDPEAHLRDIKQAPTVEEEVDRCVECGYCEPVCPSRDLTLTPRQRIVARRELVAAEARGDHGLAARLREAYEYDGEQTCAVDGMCVTACPVGINTGDLVRRLRAERGGAIDNAVWRGAAPAWGPATRGAGVALSVAKRVPAPLMTGATEVGRALLGSERIPRYDASLPAGGSPRPKRRADDAEAVLFASCTGTMFGTPGDGAGAGAALLELCDRAGVRVRTPDGLGGLCCGTPWKSKGMLDGYRAMTRRVLESLWHASEHGRLPIVVEASSCTEGLAEMVRSGRARGRGAAEGVGRMRVVDGVEFVASRVLPHLVVDDARRVETLVLHPTCATTHLGTGGALATLGRAVAREVIVPEAWGCCAYAGDRGMLHPELTAAATAAEAAEVRSLGADAHASSNRTCELGMSRATGRDYEHVLELLERATRP